MAITTQERNEIVGLVVTMFNAAPGIQVLSDLVGAYEAGATLGSLAANLSTKPQFSAVYPTSLTAQEFADRVVLNLLPASTPATAVAWSKSWIINKLATATGPSPNSSPPCCWLPAWPSRVPTTPTTSMPRSSF